MTTPLARVAVWSGWHLPELLGIGAPLLAAWLISPWCALVSAAVATWCAVHERRARPGKPRTRAVAGAHGDAPAAADPASPAHAGGLTGHSSEKKGAGG